jgi:hypothetical protein
MRKENNRMQRKPRKPRQEKIPASVNFDPAVISYLDTICEEEERSRSFVVNKIIREHAARTGSPIAPVPNQEASQEAR